MTAGRRWRGAVAALVAAAALAGAAPPARAQAGPSVEVVRPALLEPLVSATPRFVVVARGLAGIPPSSVSIELQLATTATFEGAARILTDTLPGDSVEFRLERPLPSEASIWWRAIVRVDDQIASTSAVGGPRTAARWLTLVEPDAPNGVILDTRRPRFVWSSAPVDLPPGPWRYDLEIRGVGTPERQVYTQLADTSVVAPRDLEVNTSYRWSVLAYLPTGDSIRVQSKGSFVITSFDRPLATLLYQNFPNPFPSASSRTTCIWFDLAAIAAVRLEVQSLRGDKVRTLYPRGGDDLLLRPGRYGRADVGNNSGCDQRFTWDGTSEAGVPVPAGVYLLRLRVGDRWETRKMVYRGS